MYSCWYIALIQAAHVVCLICCWFNRCSAETLHWRCETHFLIFPSPSCFVPFCRRSPAATTQPPITRVCLPGKTPWEVPPLPPRPTASGRVRNFPAPPRLVSPSATYSAPPSCPLAYVTVFTFRRVRLRPQALRSRPLLSSRSLASPGDNAAERCCAPLCALAHTHSGPLRPISHW